MVLKTQKISTF